MPWLPSIIWLALLVLFAIAEALTVGLVSIWFAAGALVALLSTFFTANIWFQIALFLLVSALSMAVIRPLARKHVLPTVVPTNADRVVGQAGMVTEAVDNEAGTGQVNVLGQTWTARSQLGVVIPQGAQITVRRIEGVKVFVETK